MGRFCNLTLTEWKCFSQAAFALQPLTLFGGGPGTGKSALCESVEFIARAASGVNLTEAMEGGACGPCIGGGAMWAARRESWQTPARSFSVELEFRPPAPLESGFYGLQVRAGDWGVFADGEILVCEGRPPEAGKSGSGVARLLSGARPGEFPLPAGKESGADTVKQWLHVALSGSGTFVPNPDAMRRPWPTRASLKMRRDCGDLAAVAAGMSDARKAQWLATLNADLAAALPSLPRFKLDVAENAIEAEAELRLILKESNTRLPSFMIGDAVCGAAAAFAAVRLAPRGALVAFDRAERFIPGNPTEAAPLMEALRRAAEQSSVTVLVMLARNDPQTFVQAAGVRALSHALHRPVVQAVEEYCI